MSTAALWLGGWSGLPAHNPTEMLRLGGPQRTAPSNLQTPYEWNYRGNRDKRRISSFCSFWEQSTNKVYKPSPGFARHTPINRKAMSCTWRRDARATDAPIRLLCVPSLPWPTRTCESDCRGADNWLQKGHSDTFKCCFILVLGVGVDNLVSNRYLLTSRSMDRNLAFVKSHDNSRRRSRMHSGAALVGACFYCRMNSPLPLSTVSLKPLKAGWHCHLARTSHMRSPGQPLSPTSDQTLLYRKCRPARFVPTSAYTLAAAAFLDDLIIVNTQDTRGINTQSLGEERVRGAATRQGWRTERIHATSP